MCRSSTTRGWPPPHQLRGASAPSRIAIECGSLRRNGRAQDDHFGTIPDSNECFDLMMPAASQDPSLRARAEELLIERSDFQIRLANNRGRRNTSSVLIQRMYSWRGYKSGDTQEDPAHHANRVTLQACREQNVFGTLTVNFDSEAGLAADALYQTEIDEYRNGGSIVSEVTQLAIDPEHGSKEVLGALFHLAHMLCLLRGVTDVFIEVNPRHVAFYRRMLNFRQVGECKICERVNAPAVLLQVEIAYMSEQIARYGGHHGRGKRSLYPYFFSRQEQEGLPRRIMGQADNMRTSISL
jgi:hypothetical protein